MEDLSLVTYNLNISCICNKITRFAAEVYKNQSAILNGFRSDDLERLKSYQEAMKHYKAYNELLDPLDTPFSSQKGNTIPVLPFPSVDYVDNDAVNEIVGVYRLWYTEMLACQSSRMSTNLIPVDWQRYQKFLDRIDAFIDNYIVPSTYLDQPETTPSFAVPPGNNVGIE